MIYSALVTFLVLNIIYELIEIVFPIKKMGGMVRSFTLIILLYAMVDYFVQLL